MPILPLLPRPPCFVLSKRMGAVTFLLVLMVVVGPAAAQAADSLSWSAPTQIDAQQLNAVSCPSAGLCVAVDVSGHVLTTTDPAGGASAWSAPLSVDPGNTLDGVSCPTTSFCVAVDDAGNALASTDPVGGAAAWTLTKIDPNVEPSLGHANADTAASVACPTTSLCVVVDVKNDIVTATDPTGGPSAWTVSHEPFPAITEWGMVTCAAATLCVASNYAAEEGAFLYSSTNPTGGIEAWPGIGKGTAVFDNDIDSGSCPSTSLCVVGGALGKILTSTTPASGPWAVTVLSTEHIFSGFITGMACPATTLCVAVGENDVLSSTDPTGGPNTWTATTVASESDTLRDVACPTTSLCMAIDGSGNVLVGSTAGGEKQPAEEPQPKEETHHEEQPRGGEQTPKPPVVSCCDGPVQLLPISVGQLKASLAHQLVPSGMGATIGALLRSGGYSQTFTALEAGGLTVQWYAVPKGAKLAQVTKAKSILVASGRTTFSGAGTKQVKLRLTATAKKLLLRAQRMTLLGKVVFRAASGRDAAASRNFVIRK